AVRDGTPALAVAWGPWRDVGMAARVASGPRESRPPAADTPAAERTGDTVQVFPLARGRDWLLDEHVVRGGEALLPGTGYLHLALQTFERGKPGLNAGSTFAPAGTDPRPAHAGADLRPGVAVLRDVVFQAPFVVPAGETKELVLTLGRNGAFAFTSAS